MGADALTIPVAVQCSSLTGNIQGADFPSKTPDETGLECNPHQGDAKLGFHSTFRETPEPEHIIDDIPGGLLPTSEPTQGPPCWKGFVPSLSENLQVGKEFKAM